MCGSIGTVNRHHLGDRPSPGPASIHSCELEGRLSHGLQTSRINNRSAHARADRSLHTGFAIAAQTFRIELPAKCLSIGFCMCTIANFFVGLSRTATIFLDRQRPHLLVRSGQLRASTGDRETLGKKTQEALHPRSSTGIFSREDTYYSNHDSVLLCSLHH